MYITTRLYLSWLLVRRQIKEYYSIGDLALLLRLEGDNVYKYLLCQYIFFLSDMIVVHDGCVDKYSQVNDALYVGRREGLAL